RFPGVVQVGEPCQFSARQGENLVRVDGIRDRRCERAVLREGVTVYREPPAHWPGDLAVGQTHLAEVLRAVVIGDEVDGLAVRGEARERGKAVKGAGQDLGFTASGR